MSSHGRAAQIKPLFTWRSAICDSNLTPTERHVALTLALHMNERGGSAFPGAPRLARETGLHLTTVKNALGRLVEAGWLEIVARGGSPRGGRRSAHQYEARIPVAYDDRSPHTTGRDERDDRSSSAHRPVVLDDPSTSSSSSWNSRAHAREIDEPTDVERNRREARRVRELLRAGDVAALVANGEPSP
jgi:hypothetical protein